MPTLTLCMIVKDEEAQLPRCLASVQGVVDEMVVVDTGSADRTEAIAESFGARVLRHPWDGSFSTARNVSLDAAGGDWILVLDADEALSRGEAVRAAIAAAPDEVEAFILPIVNFVGERAHEEAVTAPSVRVFRNRPEHRYSRALHEQIMFAIYERRPEAIVGYVEAPIEHYGYLNSLVADRDKIRRNIEIARREVERYPDDAFSWYNLGQEHFRLGEWQEAIAAYRRGFPYLQSLFAGFAPALIKHLVVSLLNLQRSDDALSVIADAKGAYSEFTDLWVLAGLALMQQGRYEAAAEQFQAALEKGEVAGHYYMSDEGVGSYKALWWLGAAYLNLGRLAEAAACYEESLAELASRRRYLAPPLDGVLQVYSLEKLSDDEVIARLGGRIDLDDVRWRELVARRLMAAGRAGGALRLLEAVPDWSPDTKLAVGMVRLHDGDVGGALAIWESVPLDSPARSDADWHRLLALLLGGRAAEAVTLFETVLAPRGEGALVALYRGLLRLWLGEPADRVPPPSLERAVGPLRAHLAQVMGLLLAAEAYELFGATLPAMAWLGLAETEQAVLVGRLYHAAGLHDAAFEALALAFDAGERSDEVLRLLGLLCLRRGALADAEALLGEVVRRQADQGISWTLQNTALLGYVAALSAQGKNNEADPLWQKLMSGESADGTPAEVGARVS